MLRGTGHPHECVRQISTLNLSPTGIIVSDWGLTDSMEINCQPISFSTSIGGKWTQCVSETINTAQQWIRH